MNIPKYVEIYRKDLKLKNYSDNTIKNYVVQVDIFLRHQEKYFTEPSKINESSIKNWLLQFNTRNSMCHSISALKLFYKLTIKQPLKFRHIEYPKSEKKLPQIIESEFLKDRIFKIENLKHRAIIMLGYSCGLRVSEVINLKIEDIDSKRMIINIRNAKGRKDRIVVLSQTMLETLRNYFKKYRPTLFMFNSHFDLQYSAKSCNEIVKKYLGKSYHFHLLRHSHSTTLLESGVELTIIQKLLGHSNIKTTQIYGHVSTRLLSKVQMPI